MKKLKLYTIPILIIIYLNLFQVGFAASIPRIQIVSPSRAYVQESFGISVLVHVTRLDQIGHYIAEINFGDGASSKSDVQGCKDISIIVIGHKPCSFSFRHSYSAPGTYQISARACNTEGTWNCSDWISVSVIVEKRESPPPLPSPTPSGGVEAGVRADRINPLSYERLGELLDRIVTILFNISIIALLFGIIFGGFLMLNSGDLRNVKLAKKVILLSIGFFGIMLIIKLFISVLHQSITFR